MRWQRAGHRHRKYKSPRQPAELPPASAPECQAAAQLFGLRPPLVVLIGYAREHWRHGTHKAYDQKFINVLCAVYQAAIKEQREIALRELGRRGTCHHDTARDYTKLAEEWGVLIRIGPTGQLLMPAAHIPRKSPEQRQAEHDFRHTGRYDFRWTEELWAYAPSSWREVVVQAYHLATARRRSPACPSVDQLRRWLRWPGSGGHDLIRQAHARELAYQAARRRAMEDAERRRQARRSRPAAPGKLVPKMESMATVIDRLNVTTQNSDRGASATPESLSPRELSSRRELSLIARTREEPATTRRYRLQRATALVNDSATAHRLLAEIERKACQVGDPAPGSVQSQLLTMAEIQLHGQRSLAWWVGRYELVCDWVIETMQQTGDRGPRTPWARPGAVAMAAMYRPPQQKASSAPSSPASDGQHGEELRRRALAALAAIEDSTITSLEEQPDGSWARRRRPWENPPDPGVDVDPASLGYIPHWYRRPPARSGGMSHNL